MGYFDIAGASRQTTVGLATAALSYLTSRTKDNRKALEKLEAKALEEGRWHVRGEKTPSVVKKIDLLIERNREEWARLLLALPIEERRMLDMVSDVKERLLWQNARATLRRRSPFKKRLIIFVRDLKFKNGILASSSLSCDSSDFHEKFVELADKFKFRLREGDVCALAVGRTNRFGVYWLENRNCHPDGKIHPRLRPAQDGSEDDENWDEKCE